MPTQPLRAFSVPLRRSSLKGLCPSTLLAPCGAEKSLSLCASPYTGRDTNALGARARQRVLRQEPRAAERLAERRPGRGRGAARPQRLGPLDDVQNGDGTRQCADRI